MESKNIPEYCKDRNACVDFCEMYNIKDGRLPPGVFSDCKLKEFKGSVLDPTCNCVCKQEGQDTVLIGMCGHH